MPLFGRRKAGAARRLTAPPIDPSIGDPAAAVLRERLAQRDWPAARDFLSTVTHPDDRAFYLGICAEVDGVQDWIEEWVAAEPGSTLPLLVRGAHAVHWAWQARGRAMAEVTSEDQFRLFYQRLKSAEDCLDEVVDRDPEDTSAWAFLLMSGRGRHMEGDEQQRRLDEVLHRHPEHLMAHEQMLQYWCKKWYGSDEKMFAFARDAAGRAEPGSPLPTLLAIAHLEKWLRLPGEQGPSYLEQQDVRAELHAAASRSIGHPAFTRRPGWPVLHNEFAVVHALGADWVAAAEQFDILGDLVTEWPWRYVSRDPATMFVRYRARCYREREARAAGA